MRSTLLCLPWLLAASSCSSPPKPPSVDESQKRPANAAVAVELQACTGELRNTRILASENARVARASGSTVARLVQQQTLAHAAVAASDADAAPQPVNTVHTALFAFGSARLTLPDAEGRRLVDDALDAPLIVLRGRTDGAGDSLVDSRIARQRAEAVGGFLVQAGIDPSRIRVTWQPYGDHVADNSLPRGRSLNRRVEIEIYRVQPQMAARGTSAAS